MLAHQAATPTRAAEVMELEAGAARSVSRTSHLDTKPPELEQRGGAYYSETAAALMADLWTGARHGARRRRAEPRRDSRACPTTWSSRSPPASTATARIRLPVAPMRPDIDALVRTMKDFELLDGRSRRARRRAGRTPRARSPTRSGRPRTRPAPCGNGCARCTPGCSDGSSGERRSTGDRRRPRRRRHQDARDGRRCAGTRARLRDLGPEQLGDGRARRDPRGGAQRRRLRARECRRRGRTTCRRRPSGWPVSTGPATTGVSTRSSPTFDSPALAR